MAKGRRPGSLAAHRRREPGLYSRTAPSADCWMTGAPDPPAGLAALDNGSAPHLGEKPVPRAPENYRPRTQTCWVVFAQEPDFTASVLMVSLSADNKCV
ncbi:hypothetical protein MRX96_007565 [Rhipicephalus microplus]